MSNKHTTSNIVDVARLAGLSVASVSRVLNESQPVSDRTRARVLAAAQTLQYSIDRRARALRMQKSGTIGLVVADVQNPFFSQTVHAIEMIAYDSKHDLFLCNSDEDPDRERLHLAAMHAQRIDGIILQPVGRDVSSLPTFVGRGTPIVCMDRHLPGADLDLAIVDNRAGSDLALRYIASHGHERIAIVTAHDATVSAERSEGFVTTMRALALPVRDEYVRHGRDARQHSGYVETDALLRLPERPTALFVTNQLLALGALNAIRKHGLRIPDDISVLGFDDSPYAELFDPPLTTIAQPTSDLGTAAAELLLDRVDRGYAGERRTVILPPTLVVRASVGPVTVRTRKRAVDGANDRLR